uniref:Uncharacterized protein n=1 Tax=Anguilla anguilla TaxID=7936 RepID=A0A0E9WW20_ANGAN
MALLARFPQMTPNGLADLPLVSAFLVLLGISRGHKTCQCFYRLSTSRPPSLMFNRE